MEQVAEQPAKSTRNTPLALEMAAITWTSQLRSQADDITQRLTLCCPEMSRIRTAGEFRAVARSLQLAAEHINGAADILEASHGA